ncbi:MAG: RNA 2'-phosphotransferase [Candidatus Coproplasma sp.]
MLNGNNIKNLSKFLAYVLRHNPSAIGIELDGHGWADVGELIDGINKTGRFIDLLLLLKIVYDDEKGRYSFSKDMTKIRANQGHSIDVNVDFEQRIPPDYLFHGTAEKYLEGIKQNGILKMSRRCVHLSENAETAFKVGSRHGVPVVLKIDAKRMATDGYIFYISANGVWQSQDIPWEYVCEVLTDGN